MKGSSVPNFNISVIFRNVTPMHSSSPTKSTISLDGKIGAPLGFPFTRMRSMNIPAQMGDGLLSVTKIPVVPGNTLRNLLRRSSLSTVFGQMRGQQTLSVGAYAAATAGSASGNPEGRPSTFDEAMKVRNHVFLGLFGGGPRLIKGKLSVDSMYPIINTATRVLGEGYEDRMVSGQILETIWVRRVDPIAKVSIEDPEQVISNARESITQWAINSLDQSNKALEKRSKKNKGEFTEEQGDTESRGLNAFNAHEVVIPGIDWRWNVLLNSPTQAQLGLVLKAIKDIEDNQMQVAGGNSRGYGLVSIEDITLNGESIWASKNYTESVEPYLDALAEDLDLLSAKDFESFVAVTEAAS